MIKLTILGKRVFGLKAKPNKRCYIRCENPASILWLTVLLVWVATFRVQAQTSNGLAYTFTTLAGKTGLGVADGIGSLAQFNNPQGIAIDRAGTLYVADSQNHTIRKITAPGVVTTMAGFPGVAGSADGLGSNARFNLPYGITVDAATNLYVTDSGNDTIRKITPAGLVSTIAGSPGISGAADGLGSAASFNQPEGIAVDGATNLYVADFQNNAIREITPAGLVSTITNVMSPQGIAADSAGNVYVGYALFPGGGGDPPTFNNGVVIKIDPSGNATSLATGMSSLLGLAVNGNGSVYLCDAFFYTVSVIPPGGTNTILAGGGQVDQYGEPVPGSADGTGGGAAFYYPLGIAVDSAGNAYVADTYNSTIREVSSAGVVSTVAGTPPPQPGNVNGTGSEARFNNPVGIASDNAGNLYVADAYNQTIRKITAAGVVSTLAGKAGVTGANNGTGSGALFAYPLGLKLDSAGNIFVADNGNAVIRKITPAGVVSLVAGSPDFPGNVDGNLYSARFYYPEDVAVDPGGNVFVLDSADVSDIRLVSTNGTVTTFAGHQIGPFGGHVDGVGTNAEFYNPSGICMDAGGNLYVSDVGNNCIRKITQDAVVTTIAPVAGYAIAVDSATNLYVPSSTQIYKITPSGTNWIVNSIAGSPGNLGSTDGTGIKARFNGPAGINVDSAGNVYVSDTGNNLIRRGVFNQFGAANLVASPPAAMNTSLKVMLTPAQANGQWHLPWEQGWHNSGDTMTNLVAGNYTVEFRNISSWVAYPPSLTVVLTNNSATTITNSYLPTGTTTDTNAGAGTLVVNLGVNPPAGAGWRFIGDNGSYLPSGYSTNLAAGTYLIEFAAVNGRVKPGSLSVPVNAGQPTYINVSYLLAGTAPANVYLPFLVSASNVTNVSQYPFGYCGQLQSDVGYGSGAAVSTNVVLTVAHLVFDDQTLSYVSQAYWFVQREAGISEPLPQSARGWYVLSGYAAERTNDIDGGYAPDQSTPQSRNLDVAALYFLSPVAAGGEGGYLPSDAVPNPWLTGTALKMLAGYPVDGSQFGTNVNTGQMYQTDPQPYPLTIAPDSVPGQQEVYEAPWVFSYPGNSGGPFYVQLNGYYYPAGVYLGTLYSGSTPTATLVRGIDSAVVNLITNAQTLGDAGTNNTGGGVTVLTSSLAFGTGGFMQWSLGPAGAVQAGAAWQVTGNSSFSTATNYTLVINTTNSQTVHFKSIPGWRAPGDQSVSVPQGYLTVYAVNYTPSNPVLVYNPAAGIGFGGPTGTVYRIETRTNLVTGSWKPVSTNTLTNTVFNLVLPKSVLTNRSGFYRAVWLQ